MEQAAADLNAATYAWSKPIIAAGGPLGSPVGALYDAVPALGSSHVTCPARTAAPEALAPVKRTLAMTIQHLNDTHKWSREQIADWLETLDVDLRFQDPEAVAEAAEGASR